MATQRKGNTIVTSVSITKEFKDMMEKYAISPSWAIRKGIAIELYEQGIPEYQSPKNNERKMMLKELLKAQEVDSLKLMIRNLADDLIALSEKIDKITGEQRGNTPFLNASVEDEREKEI